MTACRSMDFRALDSPAREVCVRIFRNQDWEIPPDLLPSEPAERLTLWKGIGLCLKSLHVRNSSNRERHQFAFVHIVSSFGKEFPIKSLWVPQVREYMEHRLSQGAAGSTVNKERAAFSRMFKVLMEYRHVDANPVAMVKGADESGGEREVYVSFSDFNEIIGHLPEWVQPIARTMYFTGMRRGEALGLKWDNVNLKSRIIRLHACKGVM